MVTQFQLVGLHPIPTTQARNVDYQIDSDQSGHNGTVLLAVGESAEDAVDVRHSWKIMGMSGRKPEGIDGHNVVIPREDGGVEVHPLKEWLRQHPDQVPAGLDATSSTSHQLRYGLRRLG